MASKKKEKTAPAALPGDSFDIEGVTDTSARLARIKELKAELAELESKPLVLSGDTRKVKVRATRLGFDGLRRRREGDVFTLEVPVELDLPSWVEKYDKKKIQEEKARAEEGGGEDEEQNEL